MTNRARSASPNSAARCVACATATEEKSTPTSEASASAGEPQPGTAAPARQVDQRLSRREGQGLSSHAEQAHRDEGERLDIRWQPGLGQFPDRRIPGDASAAVKARSNSAAVGAGGLAAGEGSS
jgi:hypothetical protein